MATKNFECILISHAPFRGLVFGLLAVALGNLWHSDYGDLQRNKLGSLCIKEKTERGEVPVHGVKAYRGSRGIHPFIPNFGCRWSWMVIITLRPLYPRERTPLPVGDLVGVIFFWINTPWLLLTTHLHQERRLRMSGAIPLHSTSWRGERRFFHPSCFVTQLCIFTTMRATCLH